MNEWDGGGTQLLSPSPVDATLVDLKLKIIGVVMPCTCSTP
jgi:hypothetical protein